MSSAEGNYIWQGPQFLARVTGALVFSLKECYGT